MNETISISKEEYENLLREKERANEFEKEVRTYFPKITELENKIIELENSEKITIKKLINSNESVSEVKLKMVQQVFQEKFETELGRYFTTKSDDGSTTLYECNIPLETEVAQWYYNGMGLLTLTLNSKRLEINHV